MRLLPVMHKSLRCSKLIEGLQSQIQLLMLSDGQFWAALLFLSVYAIACAVPLPGTRILAIGAGAVFPPALAFPLALGGALMGASLSFWAVRRFLREAFVRWLGRSKPKWLQAIQFLDTHSYTALFSLRLSPVVPFSTVHGLMALTKVGYFPFLCITFLGSLLYTSLWVFSGWILREIFQEKGEDSLVEKLPFLLGLIALSLMPILLKWAIGSKRSNSSLGS